MAAEERNGEVFTDEECTDCTTQESSFDVVARGVANGTVSRRKALRLLAVGLVGSVLGSRASVASAAPSEPGVSKCKPLAHKCLTNIDCCSRFCDKEHGNVCACTPGEMACADPSSGQLKCVPGGCAAGLGPCKIDACAAGQCVVANAPNVTPCETGNKCTVDTCDNGLCKQGAVNVTCDECFRCEETTGLCVVDATKVEQPCTDKDKCTQKSVCTAAGACVGEPVVCNDNNPCTTDTCDPTKGCVYTNVPNTPPTPCDPLDLCKNDFCVDGVCKPGPDITCDPCMVCDKDTGTCVIDVTKEGDVCVSGNKCFENETCNALGKCVGDPVVCNDNNECTTDTCDPATGCVHTKLTGTTCETGNKCTADTCDNGVCKQGPLAVTCPQCQICDTANGTCKANTAVNGTTCTSSNLCITGGATCQNGNCQGGTTKTCPKGTTCAPATGNCVCDTGTTCVQSDGKIDCCTGTDVCCATGSRAGQCFRATGTTCNNNNQCCSNNCLNPGMGQPRTCA